MPGVITVLSNLIQAERGLTQSHFEYICLPQTSAYDPDDAGRWHCISSPLCLSLFQFSKLE